MSPSELEEFVQQDPMPSLRLTLASGDQLIVRDNDRPFVSGLALVLRGTKSARSIGPSRLVSIPNIVLVEPVVGRPHGRRRR